MKKRQMLPTLAVFVVGTFETVTKLEKSNRTR